MFFAILVLPLPDSPDTTINKDNCYYACKNGSTAIDCGLCFDSEAQKIREKLQLFKDTELLFYCKDHESIHNEIAINYAKLTHKPRLFTWSRYDETADLKIDIISRDLHESILEFSSPHILYHQKYSIVKIPFTDDASIENLIHCIAVMIFLKVTVTVPRLSASIRRAVSFRSIIYSIIIKKEGPFPTPND